MRYVEARVEQEVQEYTYRIYVTDVLKGLINTNERYYDWITRPRKVETRTAEEIIDNIKTGLAKLGGESK